VEVTLDVVSNQSSIFTVQEEDKGAVVFENPDELSNEGLEPFIVGFNARPAIFEVVTPCVFGGNDFPTYHCQLVLTRNAVRRISKYQSMDWFATALMPDWPSMLRR